MFAVLPLDVHHFFWLQEFENEETDKLGPVVSNAVITSNGKLTKNFEYIEDLRSANNTVKGDFSGVERKVRKKFR